MNNRNRNHNHGPDVPFHSEDELVQEMQRPEYHRDPSFREHVRQRMRVSDLWGVWEHD